MHLSFLIFETGACGLLLLNSSHIPYSILQPTISYRTGLFQATLSHTDTTWQAQQLWRPSRRQKRPAPSGGSNKMPQTPLAPGELVGKRKSVGGGSLGISPLRKFLVISFHLKCIQETYNRPYSWFAVTMGTGIVSILLRNLPYNVSWVSHGIAVGFFILNIGLFVIFTGISAVRYALYPEIWTAMIAHPGQSLFLGCYPMGLASEFDSWPPLRNPPGLSEPDANLM